MREKKKDYNLKRSKQGKPERGDADLVWVASASAFVVVVWMRDPERSAIIGAETPAYAPGASGGAKKSGRSTGILILKARVGTHECRSRIRRRLTRHHLVRACGEQAAETGDV